VIRRGDLLELDAQPADDVGNQLPTVVCGAQVIPGLLKYGDTPEIGSLIAPRAAIWEIGRKDPLLPPAWAEKAAERLQRAYTAAGKPENRQIYHHDGGHVWVEDAAVPFPAKLLKSEWVLRNGRRENGRLGQVSLSPFSPPHSF